MPSDASDKQEAASTETENSSTKTETTETPDDLAVHETKTDDVPTPKKRSNKLRPSARVADSVVSRTPAEADAPGSASVAVSAKPTPKVASADRPRPVTDVSQAPDADAPAVTIAMVSRTGRADRAGDPEAAEFSRGRDCCDLEGSGHPA